MISANSCNNFTAARNRRLVYGSLPIKKRAFQPFKKITPRNDPVHLNSALDENGRIYDQKLLSVVSKDTDDPSSLREFDIDMKHSTASLTSSTPLQDRRYTGTQNETRCSATTTRGRECAYVAVGHSKYCNMHTDYDTNPPPRRGLSKLRSKSRKRKRAAKPATAAHQDRLAHAEDPLSVEAFVSDSSSTDSSNATTSLKGAISTKSPTIDAIAHRKTFEPIESDAESSKILLSTISSDQWLQKTVRIGAGPFKGSTGHVEKWGNGWVSVYISGIGLHNRRSFELYLHSHEEENELNEVNGAHMESIYQGTSKCCPQQAVCVSRVSDGNNRSVSPVVVTPRPNAASRTVIAPESSRSTSPVRVYSSWKEPLTEPIACNIVSPPAPGRLLVDENPGIPTIHGHLGSSDIGHNVLIASLGIPSRERCRRSIHKPSRFQEAEMLENIHGTRKRTRSRRNEDDTGKRSRFGLTI